MNDTTLVAVTVTGLATTAILFGYGVAPVLAGMAVSLLVPTLVFKLVTHRRRKKFRR
ncbi:MAG: hypothetical protein HY074_18605 [Deltaproteobacteria bacterium]|nr:hypothetical protein [Deltaproteobacteria bacterium]